MIDDVRRYKAQLKISKRERRQYRDVYWKLNQDVWAYRTLLFIARITRLLTIKKRG